jgi:hypothetical protein
MTRPQPKVRLGSMETVFTVLLVGVGLYLFFSIAPILLALIWVVIPALLTIVVIGTALYLLWRAVRAY